MENVERKKKKKNKEGVKGDGDDCGNGDDGVVSLENGLLLSDNSEKKMKKKKSKKNKEGVKVDVDDCGNGDGGVVSLENGLLLSDNSEKKMKKKRKKNKEKGNECVGGNGVENDGVEVLEVDGESKKIKKNKKEKRSRKERDEYFSNSDVVGTDTHSRRGNGKDGEKGEGVLEHDDGLKADSKKRKKEKGKSKKDLRIPDAISAEDGVEKEARKKKRKREKEKTVVDSLGADLEKEVLEDGGRKKRKTGNGKNKKSGKGQVCCDGSSTIETEKKDGENTKAKKGKKRVSFSGHVEVFPVPSDPSNQKMVDEHDLVQGRRFSAEEDKIIEEAVNNYIEERGLGEEGVDMVMHCKNHPEVKGCWAAIAKALPYRPRGAIYCRAHVLFQRGDKRKWSAEEMDLLKQLQAKHGNQWKLMADEFGRHRYHIKDAWRRLKVLNKTKGQWSQKEYQALFDLVNTDLRLKIIEDEEKRSKHGMLRDNIHWDAISGNLTTRTAPNCCMKWYTQLSSPLVEKKMWVDSDDYRLIDALFTLDASCTEDVDWDNLLGHRSGDICRERWNQMVLHIGNHMTKSFSEQVEILTKRYCPDLIEVKEAWENKPFVD